MPNLTSRFASSLFLSPSNLWPSLPPFPLHSYLHRGMDAHGVGSRGHRGREEQRRRRREQHDHVVRGAEGAGGGRAALRR